MDMKILNSEYKLCTCCMEEHEVKTIQLCEKSTFKNTPVSYNAVYYYCDLADELYADEKQMQLNDISLKDSYRKSQGLLTSKGIIAIRSKYGITQGDLCLLLGWGGKTITRYETHQIQDKAHDTILRKLSEDPEWFLALLKESGSELPPSAYNKYLHKATLLYENDKDLYLRKSIEADYAKFQENKLFNGNCPLSLDKVTDVIRYFASSPKVTSLYKVKLMKLLWYSDFLSYKENGHAITGLVYKALPMGAVPIGHNSIIDLKNVPCEEVDMGEAYAYRFYLADSTCYPYLTNEDKIILEKVISKLGKMNKTEIVNFMHNEKAYKDTAPREIISFLYAKYLQI